VFRGVSQESPNYSCIYCSAITTTTISKFFLEIPFYLQAVQIHLANGVKDGTHNPALTLKTIGHQWY
jgi:hypothetical protein